MEIWEGWKERRQREERDLGFTTNGLFWVKSSYHLAVEDSSGDSNRTLLGQQQGQSPSNGTASSQSINLERGIGIMIETSIYCLKTNGSWHREREWAGLGFVAMVGDNYVYVRASSVKPSSVIQVEAMAVL